MLHFPAAILSRTPVCSHPCQLPSQYHVTVLGFTRRIGDHGSGSRSPSMTCAYLGAQLFLCVIHCVSMQLLLATTGNCWQQNRVDVLPLNERIHPSHHTASPITGNCSSHLHLLT